MSREKVPVARQMVQEWAEGTLAEWFPGYTHEAGHDQFKIVHSGEDIYTVADTFPNVRESRRFRVSVGVVEL